jgi:hypothetical protein
MPEITWDEVGERTYETGVDHGVLYIPGVTGSYDTGVAWNGLTTVTESPSGAESNKQYADNLVYLNLISAEEFGATIEAFTYPDEFGQFDGSAQPEPGVYIGQQSRKSFGLSYRTLYGNDLEGTDYGYKLHLVYGCQAAPSEKAYATVNDSPEALAFSWELTTTPVAVGTIGAVTYKPTALLVVDSTKVDPEGLEALEDQLYGRGTAPADVAKLPLPADVIELISTTV